MCLIGTRSWRRHNGHNHRMTSLYTIVRLRERSSSRPPDDLVIRTMGRWALTVPNRRAQRTAPGVRLLDTPTVGCGRGRVGPALAAPSADWDASTVARATTSGGPTVLWELGNLKRYLSSNTVVDAILLRWDGRVTTSTHH